MTFVVLPNSVLVAVEEAMKIRPYVSLVLGICLLMTSSPASACVSFSDRNGDGILDSLKNDCSSSTYVVVVWYDDGGGQCSPKLMQYPCGQYMSRLGYFSIGNISGTARAKICKDSFAMRQGSKIICRHPAEGEWAIVLNEFRQTHTLSQEITDYATNTIRRTGVASIGALGSATSEGGSEVGTVFEGMDTRCLGGGCSSDYDETTVPE
ncbi:hypothetical protein [Aliiroseovarius sp. F47248L]|uniref:hypothetical protein n=1 Tax=Aliiroseovarius sp. F47248L TaxID=2926420 RepID=UPI001FF26F6C|nr:hypothetical protein [Aliiroseovarius sp. F47248L]MCK0139301.1 hypothetical protein [Aliiroseovarius sp. F47248L]